MAYRVLVGLSYPPDRRAEPGDVVDDIPPQSLGWLKHQGFIQNMKKGEDDDV